MANSKRFHLGDLASVTTGRVLAPSGFNAIAEILDHLTGVSLFSHQLPRAAEECAPALVERFPFLAAIEAPESLAGEADVTAWLAEQVAAHGEWFDVEPLSEDAYEPLDPFAELHQMAPHLPVIAVALPGGEA